MLIWLRHEPRDNEARAPLTPEGAAKLMSQGWRVVVEHTDKRCIDTEEYSEVGCDIQPADSWRRAPEDAIILGLKELQDDGTPLSHRHIMFGHAYKGQPSGRVLLDRFAEGGGTLLDLEYLVDDTGKRIAAFGYWAGYAGAALSVMAWGLQQNGSSLGEMSAFQSAAELADATRSAIPATPSALIIGALGRVGSGARELCNAIGMTPTKWDIAETAHGGPYPEVLSHNILLNCILAQPGAPVFLTEDAGHATRALSVVGDIACDPDSEFSPIKVYDRTTTWVHPTLRVHDNPPLDVMAIDNLPSLLPRESTEDFSAQLLPYLMTLDALDHDVWGRATKTFQEHV